MAVIVNRALRGEMIHEGNWDDWNVWQIISVTNSVCVSSIHFSLPLMSCLYVHSAPDFNFPSDLMLKSVACRSPSSLHTLSNWLDEIWLAITGVGFSHMIKLLPIVRVGFLLEVVPFEVGKNFPAAKWSVHRNTLEYLKYMLILP